MYRSNLVAFYEHFYMAYLKSLTRTYFKIEFKIIGQNWIK